MEGWIKLHRKLWSTSFARNPNVTIVFIYLLTHANHQNSTLLFGKEMTIRAGQLVTGRKSISIQTGLTEQMVRSSLVNLQNTRTITSRAYSKFSVITICNWERYQGTTNKSTNRTPTTNQQPTTNNNIYKNVKNYKKEVFSKKTLTGAGDYDYDKNTQTYKLKPRE